MIEILKEVKGEWRETGWESFKEMDSATNKRTTFNSKEYMYAVVYWSYAGETSLYRQKKTSPKSLLEEIKEKLETLEKEIEA